MKPILRPDPEPSLDEWLTEFLGDGSTSSVAVIDLSLVPSYVVEIVVAVMARAIFEALQRHRRLNKASLPTTLVLEEAHNFVHHRPFGDEYTSPGEMCVRIFERIAREGRKFGLGLVLSSQRPSELSATVLAQCNSFLLHRLVNDRDQQLVGKLVPDNLSGLLEDLPSLPTPPRAIARLGFRAADAARGCANYRRPSGRRAPTPISGTYGAANARSTLTGRKSPSTGPGEATRRLRDDVATEHVLWGPSAGRSTKRTVRSSRRFGRAREDR